MINLSSKEIYLANGGLFGFGSKKEKEEKEEAIFSCRCEAGEDFYRLEIRPTKDEDKAGAGLKQCRAHNELVGAKIVCVFYGYKKKGLEEYGFRSVDCSKEL